MLRWRWLGAQGTPPARTATQARRGSAVAPPASPAPGPARRTHRTPLRARRLDLPGGSFHPSQREQAPPPVPARGGRVDVEAAPPHVCVPCLPCLPCLCPGMAGRPRHAAAWRACMPCSRPTAAAAPLHTSSTHRVPLHTRYSMGRGGLLGDDMGLGKTVPPHGTRAPPHRCTTPHHAAQHRSTAAPPHRRRIASKPCRRHVRAAGADHRLLDGRARQARQLGGPRAALPTRERRPPASPRGGAHEHALQLAARVPHVGLLAGAAVPRQGARRGDRAGEGGQMRRAAHDLRHDPQKCQGHW